MAQIKLPKIPTDVFLRGTGDYIYFSSGEYDGRISLSGATFYTIKTAKEFPKFIKALESLPEIYRQSYTNEHIEFINDIDHERRCDPVQDGKDFNFSLIKKISCCSCPVQGKDVALKPTFGCILVDKDGYSATDARQLCHVLANTNLSEGEQILIPSILIDLIGKNTKRLSYRNGWLNLDNGNLFFRAPIFDGMFPDYKRVIPQSDLNFFVTYGAEAVEKLPLLISLASKPNYKILVENGNMFTPSSSIAVKDVKTNIRHMINGKYLQNAFNFGITTLETTDERQPFVGYKDDLIYVVMPIINFED